MSADLEDYAACLQDTDPAIRENFENIFQEASRVMSPAGLHDYLEGARGLQKLGRGPKKRLRQWLLPGQ